jgi:hypothetical protein
VGPWQGARRRTSVYDTPRGVVRRDDVDVPL